MSEPEATAEVLGTVFAEYYEEMAGKARKLLTLALVPPSVADADDLVNMAFAAALPKANELENPRAYVYGVIHREVEQLARSLSMHTAIEAARAVSPVRWDPPTQPDFSGPATDRIAVQGALADLPKQQRAAVVAVDGLGYTRQETAKRMGVHPGTVAQHVTRARVALLAALATAVTVLVALLLTAVGGAGHEASLACSAWAKRRNKDTKRPNIRSYKRNLVRAGKELLVLLVSALVCLAMMEAWGWL
ncbi:sigma-70 family RNA polymerase sigma factor [Streptomyces sp. 150FB]|uniref:RNA polymerase sigma factor n=1 Tax=Streptomyces sp. 150FB TaxID=1576605 RepID=UPI000AE426F4|nr:sigma-70 family RNA polymerase sigma factor [Streptomyces sp. 150FB]